MQWSFWFRIISSGARMISNFTPVTWCVSQTSCIVTKIKGKIAPSIVTSFKKQQALYLLCDTYYRNSRWWNWDVYILLFFAQAFVVDKERYAKRRNVPWNSIARKVSLRSHAKQWRYNKQQTHSLNTFKVGRKWIAKRVKMLLQTVLHKLV